MNTQQTVFVGLSGGVDSSVAALRLLRAGYNVVGVFIKVWHPDWLVCNWEQERLDAMRVAAKLGIPFLTCDAVEAYKQGVADYFINEYRASRTPNPDVMCNKQVKFGAFLDFAREHGADFIATGHYAQCIDGETGPELHRGQDTGKDQSYFLWTLRNQDLAAVLFPVGDTNKADIRKEAEAAGLVTAEKRDSQGICFLGHIDIKEFMDHYATLTPGPVLDSDGIVVGQHEGALIYTVGQRHGFTITTNDTERKPYYVISRDLNANTVTVSTAKPTTKEGSVLVLTDCNLLASLTPGQTIEVQTRYRQQPIPVTVTTASDTDVTLTASTTFDTPALGQSCVLYDGSRVLGGGIIAACQ